MPKDFTLITRLQEWQLSGIKFYTHASSPVMILKKVISVSLVPHQVSEAYCHSYSLVIWVRPFGTHLHLFPVLKSALSGCHFRSNEEVQQAVKRFLHSLGTNFYQDGFLKLIPRYDKYINIGGVYVEK
ncbi:hypothetical protein AVEN_79823-1 [Araneus ventricosus]|uniref:Uncharacterized protein n=1 Tax=Araneus ventricosus TaxID=182803 RepID=A0A4Y2F0S7_ARAVE|nr:hypothetical protein AVEN_79823-1 [Araneus ventricosus]